MIVYTTCRDCGGLLHVTNRDTVHPMCKPKPTKLERLLEEYLTAVITDNMAREQQLLQQIEKIETQPARLLDAALAYTRWGWPVFPLKPGTKQPATRNGFKDATTNPSAIRGWWSQADYNIGLPTGHTFDVIDIDLPDGTTSYDRMLEVGAVPDIHGQVSTSSGGRHLYVKPIPGDGNNTCVIPGIDYRADGGYVVAPPSILGDRTWTWITKPSPVITGVGDTYGASI